MTRKTFTRTRDHAVQLTEKVAALGFTIDELERNVALSERDWRNLIGLQVAVDDLRDALAELADAMAAVAYRTTDDATGEPHRGALDLDRIRALAAAEDASVPPLTTAQAEKVDELLTSPRARAPY